MKIIRQGLTADMVDEVIYDSDKGMVRIVVEVGDMELRLKEEQYSGEKEPHLDINLNHKKGLTQMNIVPRSSNVIHLKAGV